MLDQCRIFNFFVRPCDLWLRQFLNYCIIFLFYTFFRAKFFSHPQPLGTCPGEFTRKVMALLSITKIAIIIIKRSVKKLHLRLESGARASKTRQTFCAKEHFYTNENRKCNKCSNSMETSVPHSIPTVLGLEVVEVDTILGLPSAKNWCEGSCHTKNANKVGF